MSKKIIAIAGPTASGKTALAVEIAKRVSGEVVSCDSMQVYRGMDIGTAKPDETEKCGVPHHMIDILEPSQKFSVKDFVEMARTCIDDVLSRGNVPILAGGTGLYMDSVLNNVGFVEVEDNPGLRLKLQKMADEQGAEAMHSLLAKKDPQAAEKIHPNNVRRVIRALEVCEATGKTFTQANAESLREPLYDALILGIETNRSVLYDRIDRRVDIMMQNGLLDEVKKLQAAGIGKDTTAMQAIGYKELIDFVEGRASLCNAVERIKQESRRYAKRQLTWFRRNENINWVKLEEDGAIDNVSRICFEFLNKEDVL